MHVRPPATPPCWRGMAWQGDAPTSTDIPQFEIQMTDLKFLVFQYIPHLMFGGSRAHCTRPFTLSAYCVDL